MANKYTEWTVDISKYKLNKEQIERLGDLIIEEIKMRAEDGIGFKKGSDFTFPKYEKEYEASLDFDNAGKTKGKVDLTLSGDMLAMMEIISASRSKLKIGYSDSNPEQGKAEGNIRGTYGQASPIKGKARPFLGVPKNVLEKLIEEVSDGEA